jgi:hypothetical protein
MRHRVRSIKESLHVALVVTFFNVLAYLELGLEGEGFEGLNNSRAGVSARLARMYVFSLERWVILLDIVLFLSFMLIRRIGCVGFLSSILRLDVNGHRELEE